MLRCLVARLFPVPRHPGVELDVPEGREHDPRAVVESALRGLARGEITPEEAFLIARTLEKAAKVVTRRAAAPAGERPAEAARAEERAPADRLYPTAGRAAATGPSAAAPRAPAPSLAAGREPVGPAKSLYLPRRKIRRAGGGDRFAAGLRDANATAAAERRSAGQVSGATGGAPANRLYFVDERAPDGRRRDAA
jgi:hypothetical protein